MPILSQRLTMRLFTGRHAPFDVDVECRYRTWDPFAVELDILCEHRTAAAWVFARDLLADGLLTATGDGDVHVSPTHVSPTGRAATLIALGNPAQGYVLLEATTGELDGFLAHSFAAVAKGDETLGIDWATCIAALLAE